MCFQNIAPQLQAMFAPYEFFENFVGLENYLRN